MVSTNAGDNKPDSADLPSFSSRAIEHLLTSQRVGNVVGAIDLVLPDGHDVRVGAATCDRPVPLLRLYNYRALTASLRRGSLGFADAYINRDLDCSDLPGLITFYLRNRARLHASGGRLFKARGLDRLRHRLRHNSLGGSRRNISEHYDLGNDFYALWLDESMTYSSALYRDGATTLEAAQDAKLDRVRALLGAKAGQSILDIGCGWGSFACRAACKDAVHVTGLTLSQEQLASARDRAHQNGVDTSCSFELQDYRTARGQFDFIVSIEMIEAVGEVYWRQYFQMVYDRLKPGGTAVIQAITMSPDYFETYRRRPDFIQRYIFPGGMLPTEDIIVSEARHVGLNVAHVEHFGRCYARTLRTWRQRFEAAWPEIAKLGFDDRFKRRWQYYLMYCEAGFKDGVIDVGLYKLTKQNVMGNR